MKKIVFFLFFSALFCFNIKAQPTQREILLQVPVQIYYNNGDIKGLNKKNFSLRINGELRAIKNVIHKSHSIAASGANRYVALSVDTAPDNGALKESLTLFVRQSIGPTDHMLIRTPVDLYNFKAGSDKEKIVQLLQSILENDLQQRQRDKTDALKFMGQLIQNLKLKMNKVLGIRSALLFATQFYEQWRQYYTKYLLANLEFFSTAAARFTENKREKYLIHFQQATRLPVMDEFYSISKKLETYAGKLPKEYHEQKKALLETLARTRRSIMFSHEFPMSELLNVLMGVNLHCNVIFLSPSHPSKSALNKTALQGGYEKVLKTIASRTGAKALHSDVETAALNKTIHTVVNHKDDYYEVVFPFNGIIADKAVEIQVDVDTKGIYYKDRFKKQEFAFLKQWLSNRQLAVTNFVRAKRKISFSIVGLKSETVARAKVGVQLLDSTGSAVHNDSKALKSQAPSLTISMSLPDKYRGYFKLLITVRDMITGKHAELKRYIKLD